jgi:hypothetical protein
MTDVGWEQEIAGLRERQRGCPGHGRTGQDPNPARQGQAGRTRAHCAATRCGQLPGDRQYRRHRILCAGWDADWLLSLKSAVRSRSDRRAARRGIG